MSDEVDRWCWLLAEIKRAKEVNAGNRDRLRVLEEHEQFARQRIAHLDWEASA